MSVIEIRRVFLKAEIQVLEYILLLGEIPFKRFFKFDLKEIHILVSSVQRTKIE